HESDIRSFVFLHDNVHVVSGSLDGTMRKWDCDTGHLVGIPWQGKGGSILALALSPDGKTIACGRKDGKVQRCDTDGKMINRIWTGHSDWVRSLSWSPSGGHIASGSDDATILIREVESGKVEVARHEFGGHEGEISSFVFLHDDVHLVSGSWDGTMRKWDCETGLLVGEPWKWRSGSILALSLSPDGKMIACGRDDGSVERWNTNGERIEGIWRGHSNWVRSLSWSPSGGHIASGSDDGTIIIRKAASGEVKVGPIETKQGWVWSLAYSPSGGRIASGGEKTIWIWGSNTGKLLVGPIENLGWNVTSVVWSLDGSKLYSTSDESARVFDSISGALLHRFEHGNRLYSIALSPKHSLLACVGWGIPQLWDTETHQPLGHQFSQRNGEHLYCVSFSRNGRYLAYGGGDTKITLWMVE
ncbi:WD40 repeat-like protein, partial [Rhizopogon vinicolor AM-OR11-026]